VLIFIGSLIFKAGGVSDATQIAPFILMIPCGIVGAVFAVILIGLAPAFGKNKKEFEENSLDFTDRIERKVKR
jgi:hypothetical protein